MDCRYYCGLGESVVSNEELEMIKMKRCEADEDES